MNNMRICLVGHFVNRPDEGVRKVASRLAQEISKQHEVMTLNISSVGSWRKIRAFCPDIIHFVICPTFRGLAAAKFISLAYPKAKTVISAVQPSNLPRAKWMFLFRPDVVLVQSQESEEMFKALGYKTRFLGNGVDVEKFTPVDLETKQKLRNKYNLPNDKFIILHLASFKKVRNLEIFKRLSSKDNNLVLLIGRPNEQADESLIKELKQAGCVIWVKYFPNLEEIYSLSDCYVFPTIEKRASIEIPLSVLEAMSCNLPVVTTKFGALPRIFNEGDGLFFVEDEDDVCKAIEDIRMGELEVKTRGKVLPYSWENIARKVVEIYEELR